MSNIDNTINNLMELNEHKSEQQKSFETVRENNEEANVNVSGSIGVNSNTNAKSTLVDSIENKTTKKYHTRKRNNYQLISENDNYCYEQKHCDTNKCRNSSCADDRVNCSYELTVTSNGKHYIHRRIQREENKQKQQLQIANNNNDNKVCDKERNDKTINCYIGSIIKLLISTPGLLIIVILYTIMGAFIFSLLETPNDINRSALIAKSREECLKELWTITEKLNVLYEHNWTMLVHEQLRRFENKIMATSRKNLAASTHSKGLESSSSIGQFEVDWDNSNSKSGNMDYGMSHWTFNEALFYSITVITTIGQGNLTPRTVSGKIITILYALFGVPLMLMCLSSLGALLADLLQYIYIRLCCHTAPLDINNYNGRFNSGDIKMTTGIFTGPLTSTTILPNKMAECKYRQNCMSVLTTPTINDFDNDNDNDNDNDKLFQHHEYDNSQKQQKQQQQEQQQQQQQQHHHRQSQLHNCVNQGNKNESTCNCSKYFAFNGESKSLKEYELNEKCDDNNYEQHISRNWCSPWQKIRPPDSRCQQYYSTINAPHNCTTIKSEELFEQQQHQRWLKQHYDNTLITNNGYKLFAHCVTMPLQKVINKNNCYDIDRRKLMNAEMNTATVSTINNIIPTSSQRYSNHLLMMANCHNIGHYMKTANENSRPEHMLTHNEQQQKKLDLQEQQYCNNITNDILDSSYANQYQKSSMELIDSFRLSDTQSNAMPVPTITETTDNGNWTKNSHTNSNYIDLQYPKSSSIECETMQLTKEVTHSPACYLACKTIGGCTPYVQQQNSICPNEKDEDDINEVILPPPPPPLAYQAKLTSTRAITKPPTTAVSHGHLKRHATFLTEILPNDNHTLLCEKNILDGQVYTDLIDISKNIPKANHMNTETIQHQITSIENSINKNQNNNMLDKVKVQGNRITCGINYSNTETVSNIENINNSDISSERCLWMSSLTPTLNATTIIPIAVVTTPITAAIATEERNILILDANSRYNNTYRCKTSMPNYTMAKIPAAYYNSNSHMAKYICQGHALETIAKIMPPVSSKSSTQLSNGGSIIMTRIGSQAHVASDRAEDDKASNTLDIQLQNHPNTPSRVPLLSATTCEPSASSQSANNIICDSIGANDAMSEYHTKRILHYFRPSTTIFNPSHKSILKQNQQQHQVQYSTADKVQRTALRKSLVINHKGECSLKTSSSSSSLSSSSLLSLSQPPLSPSLLQLPAYRKDVSGLCYENLRQQHFNFPEISDDDMILINDPGILEINNCLESGVHNDYAFHDNSLNSLQSNYMPLNYSQIPITLVLLILIVYVSMGTMIFAFWENWSIIDGAYFCFITLTTIGYGDFIPTRIYHGPQIHMFACWIYLLVGLVLVAMTFSILETQFIWKCKRLAVRLKLVRD